MHCATVTDQEERVGPQSSGEIMTSAASHVPSASQGDQHDALCSPHISYADIIKMTLHSNDPGVTVMSNDNQVKHSGDVPSPWVSYAGMVKRGRHSNDPSDKRSALCCKLFRQCAPDLRFSHRGRSQCSRAIQCRLCELRRTAF